MARPSLVPNLLALVTHDLGPVEKVLIWVFEVFVCGPVAQPFGLCGPPLAVGSVMQHIVFKPIGTPGLSSGCVGGIEVCAEKVFGTQSKLWATKTTRAKRR